MSTVSKQTTSFSMSGMTKTLVVVFTLNLVVEKIAQLSQAIGVSGSTDWQAMLQLSFRLPHFWTGILVPVTYLVALWSAANLLKAFEDTQKVEAPVLAALRVLGSNLMYAGIAALLIVPTLESWINLGGRGIKINFDISPVAVGMIGMILKLIARRLIDQLGEQSQREQSQREQSKLEQSKLNQDA